jgi:uncharacterized low-complexity protein
MKKTNTRNRIALLAGTAFLGAAGFAGTVIADDANPFGVTDLEGGYMLAAKDAEGKCGEGKCGDDKGAEGKCGEGKCGAA